MQSTSTSEVWIFILRESDKSHPLDQVKGQDIYISNHPMEEFDI